MSIYPQIIKRQLQNHVFRNDKYPRAGLVGQSSSALVRRPLWTILAPSFVRFRPWGGRRTDSFRRGDSFRLLSYEVCFCLTLYA